MKQAPSYTPAAVLEHDDPFLSLWPHRHDYLYAPHPRLGEKPSWQTESRHPLSDRLINQSAYLYGVRFGPTTNYLLLDIDQSSPYHPNSNPQALSRIKEALDPLGLVECLTCTSSDSGGLHLYFPFSEAQKSWEIALAAATLLENRGLSLAPGTLEVFPNPKAYTGDTPSLYNAHRLPLQGCSYLLNSNLEPTFSSRDYFASIWHQVAAKNTLDTDTLEQVLRSAHRRTYRVTGKAEKFLNDLHAEIEPGWTGPGQTNHLLGRITLRAYVFGHILGAPAPLEGEALITEIIRVATSLPGFTEWCSHKEELEKKARQWARAIERSHYFHYGAKREQEPSELPSWNEQQELEARDRIRLAIATLLEEGRLPVRVRERFTVLTQRFHIGGATLYRHRDLWHPGSLRETPPDPLNSKEASGDGASIGHLTPDSPTSLLVDDASNTLPYKDLQPLQGEVTEGVGSNTFSAPISAAIAQAQAAAIETARLANLEAATRRLEQAQASHQEKLQRYLASGDPILINEALSVLAAIESPMSPLQGELPLEESRGGHPNESGSNPW